MMEGMGMAWWPMAFLGLFFMAGFWLTVIEGLITVIRPFPRKYRQIENQGPKVPPSPLEDLKERYIRGEIDFPEFERRLRELM